MKKLFITAFAVFACVAVNAQQFGVTAGYSNMDVKDGDSGSGFNVGAFVDIELSESFGIQPEVVYTGSKFDGDSYNLFSINAMLKVNVTDGLGILAGPQIGFAGGDIPDALDDAFGDDFSSTNFGLAFGLSYDFSDNIFAQARYGLQLNDHLDVEGAEVKVNQLSVGIGYKF